MMVRQRYAAQAVENAVVTGVTQHGDDFALTVEAADQPVLPTVTASRTSDARSHQLIGSGRPSGSPAADWIPMRARSWSSASERAPA